MNPVLAVGGSYYPAFEGTHCMTLAQNVQGIQIPNLGHWIPEEQPNFVIKLISLLVNK
jgi:pimeloyl-ACP methyl ester carboxylesterase